MKSEKFRLTLIHSFWTPEVSDGVLRNRPRSPSVVSLQFFSETALRIFLIFSFALAKLNNWVCPFVRSFVCAFVRLSYKFLHLDIVVWAQKALKKTMSGKIWHLEIFSKKNIFFFNFQLLLCTITYYYLLLRLGLFVCLFVRSFVCLSSKFLHLDIVVWAQKPLKKTMSGKIWHLENFRFFIYYDYDDYDLLCLWC